MPVVVQSRERAGVGRSLLQQQRQAAMRKAAATYTCDARCETQVGTRAERAACAVGCVNMTACHLAEHNLAVCTLQVKLLEGVILAFNLIIAVLVGSCMLNNLGTPTRFETPKDTGRQD